MLQDFNQALVREEYGLPSFLADKLGDAHLFARSHHRVQILHPQQRLALLFVDGIGDD